MFYILTDLGQLQKNNLVIFSIRIFQGGFPTPFSTPSLTFSALTIPRSATIQNWPKQDFILISAIETEQVFLSVPLLAIGPYNNTGVDFYNKNKMHIL